MQLRKLIWNNIMNKEQILSNFLQATTEFCRIDEAEECQRLLNIAIDDALRQIIDWQAPSELSDEEDACF